jgi:SOS-response transcriptional repressor LexA
LPLYSLRAAAGYFGRGEAIEPEGWVRAETLGLKLDEQMFVCRAIGKSMEPLICDGDFLVFRSKPGGSRQGKIVLVQYRGPADPETGGSFTVKRYSSKKRGATDDSWRHSSITLSPINADFKPIVLKPEDADHVSVVAEYLTTLKI